MFHQIEEINAKSLCDQWFGDLALQVFHQVDETQVLWRSGQIKFCVDFRLLSNGREDFLDH